MIYEELFIVVVLANLISFFILYSAFSFGGLIGILILADVSLGLLIVINLVNKNGIH